MKINKLMNRKQTGILLGSIVLIYIIVKVLFIKPYIGMADNGDFYREMNNSGLYYLTTSFNDRHFGYFSRLYGIRQYTLDSNSILLSSLSFIIKLAVDVSKLLGYGSVFDMRILAAIYCILFVFAFYILLSDISETIKLPPIITAALCIIIFGDIGYIAYFSSFYGEPASFVFLFLTLAFLVRILKKHGTSIFNLLAFLISALVFVTAKQQNTPAVVFILLLCFRLYALREDKSWKLVLIACSIFITACSAFVYLSGSNGIEHINQYHALTRGILMNSNNPEKDTEEIGIDGKYSILKGTTYYDKYSIIDPESKVMNEEFYTNYSFISIMKYYMTHSDRLDEKLNITAKNSFDIRPNVLGNYEKSEGMNYGSKAIMFSFWSTIKKRIFPDSFKFILLFYVVYFAGLIKLYVDKYRKNDTNSIIKIEAFAAVALIGVMQFGISFVGAGDADLAKHLFLFNVCFDFMFLSELIFLVNIIYFKLHLNDVRFIHGYRHVRKRGRQWKHSGKFI